MLNNKLEKIKIEYLKIELTGNAKEIEMDQKEYGFESSFRFFISQSENGGNCIKNLEDDKLFLIILKQREVLKFI